MAAQPITERPKAFLRIAAVPFAAQHRGFKDREPRFPIEIAACIEGLDPRHSDPARVGATLDAILRQTLHPDIRPEDRTIVDAPSAGRVVQLVTRHIETIGAPRSALAVELETALMNQGYNVVPHEFRTCQGRDRIGSARAGCVPTGWLRKDLCWNHPAFECTGAGCQRWYDLHPTIEKATTAGRFLCGWCGEVVQTWSAGEPTWEGPALRDPVQWHAVPLLEGAGRQAVEFDARTYDPMGRKPFSG